MMNWSPCSRNTCDAQLAREGNYPLQDNSQYGASRLSKKLSRACDFVAIVILLIQVSGVGLVTICRIGYVYEKATNKEMNIIILFIIFCVLLGVFASLYGCMRSLYQIIYNVLHDQELLSFSDNLMLYISVLITPFNLLAMAALVAKSGIHPFSLSFFFMLLFILIIHVFLLVLSMVRLLKNKRNSMIEPLNVLHTSVIAYWSTLIFCTILFFSKPFGPTQ